MASKKCEDCKGLGTVEKDAKRGDEIRKVRIHCEACNGSGLSAPAAILTPLNDDTQGE